MPNGKKENPGLIKDYSGGINITSSPLDVQPNECSEASNVKFFKPDGCISPRPGRRWMVGVGGNPVVSSLSTEPIGIYQFQSSAGSMYPMIATCTNSPICAQFGFLSGDSNGAMFNDLLVSDHILHYDWSSVGIHRSHAEYNNTGDADFVIQEEIPADTPAAGSAIVYDAYGRYFSHAANNASGATTFEVTANIITGTPVAGYIYINSGTSAESGEWWLDYKSWTGKIFTLADGVSCTENFSAAGAVSARTLIGNQTTYAFSSWDNRTFALSLGDAATVLTRDYDGDDLMFIQRQDGEAVSAFKTYPYSADHVCMASYDGHVLATWAPSSDYVSAAPPLLWDGVATGSATALHISSEPLLGPEDDQSGLSADRFISTMIGLSAKFCGTFKGYLFLYNTVEHEIVSSDGSGAGVYEQNWHPYRLRWNNPAASSIKCVEESAGGAAWDYMDYLDLDPTDGYGITGFGEAGDELLIFKRGKTFSISWVGGSDVFNFRKASEKIGCVSHRSVASYGGGVAWCAEDGIYYWANGPVKISDNVDALYQRRTKDRECLITGGLWPELRQIWWSIPLDGADLNNYGLIYDFHHGDPQQECWATASLSIGNIDSYNKTTSAEASAGLWCTDHYGWSHIYDETLTYETSGTQTADAGATTKVSGGFAQSWKSRWLDFEDLDHVKRIKQIKSILTTDADAGLLSIGVRKNWEAAGSLIASSARNLSGRGSDDALFLDKCNFTCPGQVFQIHYSSSAAPGLTTGTPSSHNWTLHETEVVYDTLGTVFYGDY